MASPTIFTYTIEDEFGTKASCDFYVGYDGSTGKVDDLTAAAKALGDLINDITDGRMLSYAVKIPLQPDSAWNATPASGSRCEQTLLENFRITVLKYNQGFDIPALKNALINSDKKPIIGSGAIKALNDAIVAGGLGPLELGQDFRSKENNDLAGLQDASVSFRKHRRSVKATTTALP